MSQLRPQLTPAQADGFRYAQVLRYTGPAGADRADPWHPAADPTPRNLRNITPDYLVDPNAVQETLTRFRSLQGAIDHALSVPATGRRIQIALAPGQHAGPIYLPIAATAPFTLYGVDPNPRNTCITANIDAEMPGTEYAAHFGAALSQSHPLTLANFERIAARDTIGTFNSSVLRIEGDDTQVFNLTIRNDYAAHRPRDDEPATRNAAGQLCEGQHQAVALHVAGADRVHLDGLRLSSFQDTLFLQSPSLGTTARTFLANCHIEGDVDFIFGQATGYFTGCQITSRGSRAPHSWVAAPSTNLRSRYGFVFDDCTFTHDGSPTARAGRFSLGRQWFEGVRATPYGNSPAPQYSCELGTVSQYQPPTGTISRNTLESVGKCVILNSRIGPHINAAAPWDDWNGGVFATDGSYTPRPWSPRFRPVQFTAAAFLRELQGWPPAQRLDFSDIDPAEVFLGEYANQTTA